MEAELEIDVFVLRNGKAPFEDWLSGLDRTVRNRVRARLLRVEVSSHFGPVKQLAPDLFEMKFKNLGGGLRIYFGIVSTSKIVLLCGGDKKRQSDDIKLAGIFLADYFACLGDSND